MKKYIFIALIISILASCKDKESEGDKKPLAKVFDKYLYLEDIQGIITDDISPADSAAKINSYINNWVKKELLVKKAELNLSEKDNTIQKMIDEYRADLLIHTYMNELIQQKLDTVITEQQLVEYYDKQSAQFLLNFNIVKVLFVKISSDVKDLYKVRNLYRSNRADDMEKLEKFCRENSATFDNFSDEWVQFSDILEYLPEKLENQSEFLKSSQTIETKDSLHHYFVQIKDYKLTGEVSPLKFVESNLKTIILKERKSTLLSELEQAMFENALNNGNIKIYTE